MLGAPANLTFLNSDQWDGYQADQAALIAHLGAQQLAAGDVVVLTGDIHSSWAMDIPAGAGAGYTPVGAEFVCPSVTSDGFYEPVRSALPAPCWRSPRASPAQWPPPTPWIRYLDGIGHGYTLIDVTPERVQADYHHTPPTAAQPDPRVDPALEPAYMVSWQTLAGSRRLSPATGPVGPRHDTPPAPTASAHPPPRAPTARCHRRRRPHRASAPLCYAAAGSRMGDTGCVGWFRYGLAALPQQRDVLRHGFDHQPLGFRASAAVLADTQDEHVAVTGHEHVRLAICPVCCSWCRGRFRGVDGWCSRCRRTRPSPADPGYPQIILTASAGVYSSRTTLNNHPSGDGGFDVVYTLDATRWLGLGR